MANTFAKLAQLSPMVVRSLSEQAKKEKAMRKALPILESLRKSADRSTVAGKLRSERYTLAMRQLSLPMYTVEVEGQKLAISASVLQDWRQNRIDFVLVAMPVARKQLRGVSTVAIENAAIENAQAARANDHAMGLAQTAWRLAHIEGDKFAERCAYHWLYHGSLVVCKDKNCKACGQRRRLQPLELYHGGFRYIDPDFAPRRLAPKLKPHRMPKPDREALQASFGEWLQVGNDKRTDATAERRAKPVFRLRDAILAKKAH